MNLSTSQDAGIHVGQVMQFACTLELSAPKDLAKMYNFVSFVIIVTIIRSFVIVTSIRSIVNSTTYHPKSIIIISITTIITFQQYTYKSVSEQSKVESSSG